MQLRPYQQIAVDKALNFFRREISRDIPIIVAPTGSGKSLIIANIAKELTEPVIVLQPSVELVFQNYNKFTMYGGEASIYSASANKKQVGHVTYATIGSIKNKPEDFSHFKYIIIDECH